MENLIIGADSAEFSTRNFINSRYRAPEKLFTFCFLPRFKHRHRFANSDCR
jgi:hypothetical protein